MTSMVGHFPHDTADSHIQYSTAMLNTYFLCSLLLPGVLVQAPAWDTDKRVFRRKVKTKTYETKPAHQPIN